VFRPDLIAVELWNVLKWFEAFPRNVSRLAGSKEPPPRLEMFKPVDHFSTAVAAVAPKTPCTRTLTNGRLYGM
jgi:hypothetical protein